MTFLMTCLTNKVLTLYWKGSLESLESLVERLKSFIIMRSIDLELKTQNLRLKINRLSS
jgi:hypothetical protein